MVSVILVAWQGSFSGNIGSFAPNDAEQTFVFYAVSILIFLLMVALGFMLVRLIVKLWIERQRDRAGSRIRTKLVVGALALSLMPVFFMVLFSVYVLNATMQKWFDRPVEHELVDLVRISSALDRQTRDKANAEAELLANMPGTRALLADGNADTRWLAGFCRAHGILAASITLADGAKPVATYGAFPGPRSAPWVSGAARIRASGDRGTRGCGARAKGDQGYYRAFLQLSAQRKFVRTVSFLVLALIALFIFSSPAGSRIFWHARSANRLPRCYARPRKWAGGNLGHRVKVNAVDELAQLVSGFNRMTSDLEANRAEIDTRGRFTEAILESIPTGVISVDSAGAIQRVNKALEDIFPHERRARRLVWRICLHGKTRPRFGI